MTELTVEEIQEPTPQPVSEEPPEPNLSRLSQRFKHLRSPRNCRQRRFLLPRGGEDHLVAKISPRRSRSAGYASRHRSH